MGNTEEELKKAEDEYWDLSAGYQTAGELIAAKEAQLQILANTVQKERETIEHAKKERARTGERLGLMNDRICRMRAIVRGNP